MCRLSAGHAAAVVPERRHPPAITFTFKSGGVVEVVFIVKYAYAWVRTDWPITLLVAKLGLAALATRQVWLAFPHGPDDYRGCKHTPA